MFHPCSESVITIGRIEETLNDQLNVTVRLIKKNVELVTSGRTRDDLLADPSTGRSPLIGCERVADWSTGGRRLCRYRPEGRPRPDQPIEFCGC